MPSPATAAARSISPLSARSRGRPRTCSQPCRPGSAIARWRRAICRGRRGRADAPAGRARRDRPGSPPAPCGPARSARDQRGIGSGCRSAPPGRSRRRRGRRPVVERDVELDPRMLAANSARAGARCWTPKDSGRAEPDRPGDLGHRLGHHLLGRLELGEDVGGALEIGLADVGRLGAPARSGSAAGRRAAPRAGRRAG
jgi:hypothetical protein